MSGWAIGVVIAIVCGGFYVLSRAGGRQATGAFRNRPSDAGDIAFAADGGDDRDSSIDSGDSGDAGDAGDSGGGDGGGGDGGGGGE
jgi:hypothetical protein